MKKNLKFRIVNRTPDTGYWVEALIPFEGWNTYAVVYDYKLARKFVKTLREHMDTAKKNPLHTRNCGHNSWTRNCA